MGKNTTVMVPERVPMDRFENAIREIGVVAIGRLEGLLGPATTLAAAFRPCNRDGDLLLEARRPDQLPAEPRPAVEARDRSPFRRGEAVDLLEARTFDDLVPTTAAAEPGLIDAGTG